MCSAALPPVRHVAAASVHRCNRPAASLEESTTSRGGVGGGPKRRSFFRPLAAPARQVLVHGHPDSLQACGVFKLSQPPTPAPCCDTSLSWSPAKHRRLPKRSRSDARPCLPSCSCQNVDERRSRMTGEKVLAWQRERRVGAKTLERSPPLNNGIQRVSSWLRVSAGKAKPPPPRPRAVFRSSCPPRSDRGGLYSLLTGVRDQFWMSDTAAVTERERVTAFLRPASHVTSRAVRAVFKEGGTNERGFFFSAPDRQTFKWLTFQSHFVVAIAHLREFPLDAAAIFFLPFVSITRRQKFDPFPLILLLK